jgi:dTDP-4-amino-4,6-dideoxygalactose transaminase
MKKNNIEASAHFDPPLHVQKYLKKFHKTNLKNTEKLSKEIATLPIYPSLKSREIKTILKTIERWCKKIK